MRRLIVVTTLLLIIGAFCLPTKAAGESYDVTIQRMVTISDWGIVSFDDNFTISNSGTSPLAGIDYAIPRSIQKNLQEVKITDSTRGKFTLDRDVEASSQFYWIRVNFPEKISPGGKITFYLSTAYTNIIKILKAGEGGATVEKFTLSMPAFATIKTSARWMNVTIRAVDDARYEIPRDSGFSATESGGSILLSAKMIPLPAMTDRQLSLNYTSQTQRIARCETAKREIEITPSGDLKISESYQLRNLARALTSFKLTLPKEAKNIATYDELGVLSTGPFTSNQIDVSPRFKAIKQDEAMTLLLTYEIPAGSSVKQTQWWGLFNLNFDLLSNLQWPVEKAEIIMTTPVGLRIEKITPTPTTVKQNIYNTALVYEMTGVTPVKDLQLTMTYRYIPFWAAFTPMVWATIAIGSVVGAKLLLKRKKPTETPSVVPIDIIKRYVDLNDERMSLRLELDKINQELARGAISRHEHRRRSRLIEERDEAIRKREIRPVRSTLVNVSTRHREILGKIERAEAEFDAARASETQLRSQYRSGRISRSVYDQMSAQVRRRIDRSRETINSEIVTLREEAG